MIPTIGMQVLYTFNDLDAADFNGGRTTGVAAVAGQQYPATIVRTWGQTEESAANLQVLMDGPHSHWVTSRTAGEGPGHWVAAL